jgi:hypothetical protein
MADEEKPRPRKGLRDILEGKTDLSGIELPPETQEKLRETNERLAEAARRYIAERISERQSKEEQEQERQRIESELIDRAISFLQNKWGERPCPYCEHVEWQVAGPIELSVSGDEAMSPAFPVMCGNCGHTTFVNAIRAGLLPEPEEE